MLGTGAWAAAPSITVDPALDPAVIVARVRASGAAAIRVGEAFNDYAPAAYKSAWAGIREALRASGLSHVRMEWAFRPSAELVPFMDWHPGAGTQVSWRLAAQFDGPSTRSFLAEASRSAKRPA